MELRSRLRHFFCKWYREHGREFPWREEGTSAYGILVAEMLLRQTRAEKVTGTWAELVRRYPTAEALAGREEGELLELLRPLGLAKQRAGALRAACSVIVDKHGGKVPPAVNTLGQLPHVGMYTANAVACFAFHRRVAIVDVNVMRVLSRITGTPAPADNRRAAGLWDMARSILPLRRAWEHNYGLLDFSSQVCTAREPQCGRCPLAKHCVTGQQRLAGHGGGQSDDGREEAAE